MLNKIQDSARGLPRRNSLSASRPLRVVLRWQVYVTVALALLAAVWGGRHAAASVLLGGLSIVTAGYAYAVMISGRRFKSAGEILRTLVRAEAVKVGLIVLQLWAVLTLYREVVAPLFIATFAVMVLVYPAVLLVREKIDIYQAASNIEKVNSPLLPRTPDGT